MRRRTAALALLALLVAAACAPEADDKVDSTTAPAAVAAASVSTKADEDSIRAIVVRIGTVMSAHDTAAVAALYAADAVDFTPGMSPAEGRTALVKEYADMFRAAKDLKFTVTPGDVMVAQAGDLAVSRASYEMTTTGANGKPATERGNVVLGWKKANGQWKIAVSMNAPTPPAP
jgi:uncharacterized protein (TIGR02246 family)